MQRVAGFKQAVQFTPLAENRGFRRIQVFGFVVAQHPPAKADAFALDVADRKHDPVAETVVALGFAGRSPGVRLAGDDQAAFDQQGIVVIGKHAGQAAPAFRGIPEAKSLGDFTRDAAPLEILDRPFRGTQIFDIGQCGFFQHAGQRRLLFAQVGRPGPVLRRNVVFGHLQAVLLGQVLDGLNECHAGMVHQEADGVAIFAATKAVVELFRGADAEGGRFFAMKRAQAHEVGAAFFELHIAADDIDHVGTRQQLLNE